MATTMSTVFYVF